MEDKNVSQYHRFKLLVRRCNISVIEQRLAPDKFFENRVVVMSILHCRADMTVQAHCPFPTDSIIKSLHASTKIDIPKP